MSRTPTHADLVARALDALPGAERARIDAALERDPALRRRFEEIAGHLLQYDHLPPAPPPPPFVRLAAELDAEVAPDRAVLRLQRPAARLRPALAWTCAAAAAAALVVALLLGSRGREAASPVPRLVAGPGLEVLREGGTVLTCAQPAEARLGERVRLVLDAGARLRVEREEAVDLEAGRAWFEVGHGPFEVGTPQGAVRVRGTVFEVDLRSGGLVVAVAEGRVWAAGLEVAAGERLVGGVVATSASAPGTWFRAPRLGLEPATTLRPAPGKPLELRLVFANPGLVPLELPGPAAARTPLWIRFETLAGRTLGELPVKAANVTDGRGLLQPGGSVVLEPGGRSELTLRILPPPGCPPAYRCVALYRPEAQPAVLSSPLEIEVR